MMTIVFKPFFPINILYKPRTINTPNIWPAGVLAQSAAAVNGLLSQLGVFVDGHPPKVGQVTLPLASRRLWVVVVVPPLVTALLTRLPALYINISKNLFNIMLSNHKSKIVQRKLQIILPPLKKVLLH